MHIADYDRGYRDGIRAAATWLARRGEEMNDQHAKHIIFSAATHLGWDFSAGRINPLKRKRWHLWPLRFLQPK